MAQSPSPYVREQAVQGGLGINVNKVIKNTYMLLGMTLLFSAAMAWVSMSIGAGFMSPILSLVISLGLLFAVQAARNSIWALPLVFAFTGFFGFNFGPLLSVYLANPALSEILMTALGSTAFIFFGLSAYVMVSKKDFSFLRGFVFVGLLVLVGASLVSLFVDMSGLSLAISAGAVLLASALILFDTSRIIHGGETNYIMATVSLYLDIYMLFIHLLNLLTALSGRD
ncbi:Bax inhibitor-1/YccA family protein [Sansalvadorimonas sp. 2012CJ34-2]|uniref:Bax inhibitor-1/YccA family protein n=1 Tax=Parendozoicomonas callyspongiae TaxID=2942213 RepID=A0ABT0PBZ4_9GAMM|nr:Bax inhibitor-1/YccA family protein [Sansalvadorimonas sp. 2012CJ34-2]MCL6268808.1 Bax inhibitor-1/YccA family protein [Sansalvadorimonas sp. 2012CJ34-2]